MALMRDPSDASSGEAANPPGTAALPLHTLPELIKATGLLHEAEQAASRALIELSKVRSQAQAVPDEVCESCDRYGHPQDAGGLRGLCRV